MIGLFSSVTETCARWVWELKFSHPEPVAPDLTFDEIWTDDLGLRIYSNAEGHYLLVLFDSIATKVFPADRVLEAALPVCQNSNYTLRHFLLDQVLPRAIAYDGRFVVHAGGIAHNSQTILITGPSGLGKSTLVGSFSRAGYSILNDDALVLTTRDDGICAAPIYPGLRLLPDSLEHLFDGEKETEPVAHYTSKQRIPMPVAAVAAEANVSAIFILAPPSGNDVTVRRAEPAAACMTMIKNSFTLDPTDPVAASSRLLQGSVLANAVPAFEISYPRDYARLPEVREVILRCAESPD